MHGITKALIASIAVPTVLIHVYTLIFPSASVIDKPADKPAVLTEAEVMHAQQTAIIDHDWFRWDRMIKNNLRDPSSYIRGAVSQVVAKDGSTVAVTVTYRAKNGFGGYNIESAIFVYRWDKVSKTYTL